MKAGSAFGFARIALLALAACLCAGGQARAQSPDLEDAVKATFLNRFASFIEWPASAFDSPTAPLIICVSGATQFGATVERAATGESAGGRTIYVRHINVASPQAGCHVLYVSGAPGQSVAEGLSAVRGTPVLTVTDARYGNARGAIHFVVVGDRVRFHIDRAAAEANGLAVSARLLNIALSVRGGQ